MLFRAKKATTRATEESRIERALKELGDYSLAQLVDGQVIARFRDDLGAEKVKVMVRKPEAAPKRASIRRPVSPIVPKSTRAKSKSRWAGQCPHACRCLAARRAGRSR